MLCAEDVEAGDRYQTGDGSSSLAMQVMAATCRDLRGSANLIRNSEISIHPATDALQ